MDIVEVESNKMLASPPPLPPYRMSIKKQQLYSTTMKRTSQWVCSQEAPSDIKVQAGGTSLALHKLPLVSKSGYIRKFTSGAKDVIEIPNVPGGAEAFELAARFCYGINFEINVGNIAMLRCVADYLEMTEEQADGNLVNRTEAYLTEVALNSLSGAVQVLHSSESLLPAAEKLKLVSRCIDAIADFVCTDNLHYSSGSRTENSSTHNSFSSSTSHSNPKAVVDWWAEELIVLRIDMFQRVLVAIKARGCKHYAFWPVLMMYAQKSLRALDIFGRGKKKIEPRDDREKRVVLETVVGLLPRESNSMSVSFLSMLIRAAIYLDATVACRLDLEKRMGLQLSQAALDDLLIPSCSHAGATVFDVDTVQRILVNHLNQERGNGRMAQNSTDDHHVSLSLDKTEKVGRLMESYLAEVATDPNLSVAKFMGLAELIPEQARVIDDGMYRAVDIYLKAHSSLTEIERKKVCSLMDCQKLSREACAHAAQNERLPVQIVVHVLFYEQQRFRDAMNGPLPLVGEPPTLSKNITPYTAHVTKPCSIPSSLNELSTIKRENEDLKLELLKMKMKLKKIEKPSGLIENTPSIEKPSLPKTKSFISSVSKTLGKINPFVRGDGGRTRLTRDRRHSIS